MVKSFQGSLRAFWLLMVPPLESSELLDSMALELSKLLLPELEPEPKSELELEARFSSKKALSTASFATASSFAYSSTPYSRHLIPQLESLV